MLTQGPAPRRRRGSLARAASETAETLEREADRLASEAAQARRDAHEARQLAVRELVSDLADRLALSR